MRLEVYKNYDEVSLRAANIIASQVIVNPKSVLGLATGSSPIGTYNILVQRCQAGQLDFSQVRSVNLDEYKGLGIESDQSYVWFMHHHLFDKINIKAENIHLPNGKAQDFHEEAKNYDALIDSLGGTDIQLLGIGHNGHIGFNEPSEEFIAPTHVVDLQESTIEANKRFFTSIDEVPKQAITMGMHGIMTSKKILLIATGKAKADAVRKTLNGSVTPKVPASILQLHRDVTILVDQELADNL